MQLQKYPKLPASLHVPLFLHGAEKQVLEKAAFNCKINTDNIINDKYFNFKSNTKINTIFEMLNYICSKHVQIIN